MTQNEFVYIVYTTTADVIARFSARFNLQPKDAIVKFMKSQVFSELMNEDTEVWHGSVEKIMYDFYRENNISSEVSPPLPIRTEIKIMVNSIILIAERRKCSINKILEIFDRTGTYEHVITNRKFIKTNKDIIRCVEKFLASKENIR